MEGRNAGGRPVRENASYFIRTNIGRCQILIGAAIYFPRDVLCTPERSRRLINLYNIYCIRVHFILRDRNRTAAPEEKYLFTTVVAATIQSDRNASPFASVRCFTLFYVCFRYGVACSKITTTTNRSVFKFISHKTDNIPPIGIFRSKGDSSIADGPFNFKITVTSISIIVFENFFTHLFLVDYYFTVFIYFFFLSFTVINSLIKSRISVGLV